MRALAKLQRAPGLTMTKVRKPDVGHNDVLIKIRKTAICGTDIPPNGTDGTRRHKPAQCKAM